MAEAADSRGHAPRLLGISLKLYLDIERTREWARSVADIALGNEAVRAGAVRLFVLPSFPALPAVERALSGTLVDFGAQDLHWEDRGPYTGAVSGTDLAAIGCRLVEVGHAERRRVFGETDEVVRLKIRAALRNDLTPVLCVGEDRPAIAADAVSECFHQIDSSLIGADLDGREIIVAYEPRWAIGAPEPAPAPHVRIVTAALRDRLASLTNLRSSAVIYGGSAQRGTLTALGDSVNGLFLGRFAHDPRELAAIVEEAAGLP